MKQVWWKRRQCRWTVGVSALVLSLFVLSSVSVAGPLKLRGYAESRYTFSYGTDLNGLCDNALLAGNKKQCQALENPHILVNRIRPSALVKFNSKARLRATANFLTSHFKLDREITKIEDLLTLQRLYLDLRLGKFDVRAGMQAFRWGPAQLWNLTIPFNPQDPTDPAAELPGLWGLNVYFSYSATGGIRAAVLATPDMKHMIQLVRWKHTFGLQDVAVTGMHDEAHKRFIAAVDIKGELTVGFWLEAAVYLPYEKINEKDDDDTLDPSFAFVVGIDYTFPVMENLYVSAQFYYNSKGITDPAKYPWKDSQAMQQMAAFFQSAPSNNVTGIGFNTNFLGAYYLLVTARLSLNEDMSLSLTGLSNLIDPAGMVGPMLSYTFLDNFSASLGAYYFFGQEGSEYNWGELEIPIEDPPVKIKISPVFAVFAWLRYNF